MGRVARVRSAGVFADLRALSQEPDRIWAALSEAQPRMDGTDAGTVRVSISG
jgi:hypothetical protein